MKNKFYIKSLIKCIIKCFISRICWITSNLVSSGKFNSVINISFHIWIQNLVLLLKLLKFGEILLWRWCRKLKCFISNENRYKSLTSGTFRESVPLFSNEGEGFTNKALFLSFFFRIVQLWKKNYSFTPCYFIIKLSQRDTNDSQLYLL